VQNYYQAHGSGASWEWLATISPCIEVLRRLATEVNGSLGSKQGNRHAAADLTKDISILMDSLKQNNIYEEVLGRTLGDDEGPAPDVIGEGYTALTWGAKSPLRQFNRMVKTLQQRCSVRPLMGTMLCTQTTETSKFTSSPTTDLLTLRILASNATLSAKDNGLPAPALIGLDAVDPSDGEELELNEDLEEALDDAQPILSLQTADDVDLEMDMDLQELVEAFDEGDVTDNTDGDDMD
jgi:hypothetical protein